MKKLILLLLAVVPFSGAWAQLSIAPTAVYLDRNGIGNLFVTNNSGVPQEITIGFQFGYSDQDENGVLIMVYNDSINAKNHSLDGMIKAFPRTFILPPNQQQIVRLQARVPKDAKPGMFFTRLKIGSSGQVADVGVDESDAGGISTRVNLRFEQVIVCFYKNGDVKTGLSIEQVKSRIDSNLLTLDLFYRTTGNAPYLGRVKMIVKGPDGKIVGEISQSVAMYFLGKRRFRVILPKDFQRGLYTIESTFLTERSDIDSEDLVQASPYNYKATIRLD